MITRSPILVNEAKSLEFSPAPKTARSTIVGKLSRSGHRKVMLTKPTLRHSVVFAVPLPLCLTCKNKKKNKVAPQETGFGTLQSS